MGLVDGMQVTQRRPRDDSLKAKLACRPPGPLTQAQRTDLGRETQPSRAPRFRGARPPKHLTCDTCTLGSRGWTFPSVGLDEEPLQQQKGGA